MITTKWPRLIVVGEPVTEAQADEILVRTNEWRLLSTNDRDWQSQVEQLAGKYGYPPEVSYDNRSPEAWRDRSQRMERWQQRLGILDLHYVHNDRVMSSWIGGPHGWCDWDGTIGCATFNIGKWPSDDEVTEDWQAIAAAFPYLNLTAQCVDDEGEGALAAQWRVVGGDVEYDPEPTEQLAAPVELTNGEMLGRFWAPGAERGVSLDRLRQAFERVAAASVAREHGKES